MSDPPFFCLKQKFVSWFLQQFDVVKGFIGTKVLFGSYLTVVPVNSLMVCGAGKKQGCQNKKLQRHPPPVNVCIHGWLGSAVARNADIQNAGIA